MSKSTNKESKKKNTELKKALTRLFYITMFSGSLAISAYFLILVSDPDLGQTTLAVFSLVSGVYYLSKAIR